MTNWLKYVTVLLLRCSHIIPPPFFFYRAALVPGQFASEKGGLSQLILVASQREMLTSKQYLNPSDPSFSIPP